MLAGGGYDLGLLLDGDADRAGAADEQGTFIHQLEVTGLLMYYLVEYRGLREPVVSSVNNTSMVARLGEHYGVPVFETSVGFKYVGPKMIETGAMMGGEESGGYGFGMHLPERDGDLCRPAAARPVHPRAGGRALAGVGGGGPLPRDRRAVVLPAHRRARRPRRVSRPQGPAARGAARARRRASSPASRVDADRRRSTTNDGFKFFTADGSWLLVRFSGTEPLVRVYAEAATPEPARRLRRRPANGSCARRDPGRRPRTAATILDRPADLAGRSTRPDMRGQVADDPRPGARRLGPHARR